MENRKLAYRMYFFVPYNISPIQQAIQAGHAALEYAMKYHNTKNHDFLDFMKNDKTWIILNGGTTNKKRDFNGIVVGSLNQIGDDLLANDIKFSYFEEPDLNDALTAVCFLADERVWDYENYPEFYDWLSTIEMEPSSKLAFDYAKKQRWKIEQLKENFSEYYKQWIQEVLGEEKNEFLRNLIRGKKLA